MSEKARTAVDQMNHSGQDKTSRRKEIAKIAGVGEGTIERARNLPQEWILRRRR